MTIRPMLRALVVFGGIVVAWQAVVVLTAVPPYILPGPAEVAAAWLRNADRILGDASVTLAEIALGLAVGILCGALAALAVAASPGARRWLLPLLVASQAIPVFALAPLLVLWLGYGMASKIAMAALVIFFPVAAAFHDGLREVETGWLDLARVMQGGRDDAAARLRAFAFVRVPAALPGLASGVRIGAAVAPIGAVIGEWVGSGSGLGHLMLHANGRMQVDLMFAALFTLAALAVFLWFATDRLVARLLHWRPRGGALS